MKKLVYILIALFLITGCQTSTTLEVSKRTGETEYKAFRTVSDAKQVKRALRIVESAKWEQMKAEMTRPADYQFSFPHPEAKAVLYECWVEGDSVLLTHADNMYATLSAQEAKKLLAILIEET
ncbi:hypothetical protein MUG87_18905 [Ectobacillus sp. JY-23]|uniref:hypothetical protein n=1 Tax=Ectobacillus sp. JY-23 TaxID=2933872 RepID=UPI001FF1E65E|nr:hypothetical protein [Ectobacillus sp. JY-23]UOY92457.1 hypothetical protein MUG87_18905 [Ectobacillus sp. JY-23]